VTTTGEESAVPTSEEKPTVTTTESETIKTSSGATETPIETPQFNETNYSVGYPWAPFGDTFFPRPLCLLDRAESKSSSFTLLDTISEWKQLTEDVTSIREYPFVKSTNFDDQSIIVFATRIISGKYLTVTKVAGVSDGNVHVVFKETGRAHANGTPCHSVFVRIPANKNEINRVQTTIKFDSGHSETRTREY
jgi:hypothetical protein